MSPPESQITPNLFLSSTKSVSSESSPPTTVFFISGNPGLVSYYHDFLSLVSEKLASSSPGKDGSGFRIYGANLGGFEINEKEKANAPSARLYNVEEQIDFVEKKLHILINESRSKSESETNRGVTRSTAAAEQSPKQKVILIGHSVGTYIAMEILRRHREEKIEDKDEVPFDIIGAVLLFPTVMELAKSAAGTRLTWLLYLIPQLALVASLLAKFLTFAFPDSVLRALIRLVMKDAPSNAVETTLSFLKSENGVRQALYMGADEVRTITTDKWDDDIWGTSTAGKPPYRLVFYFGRKDHWVAERTRDDIIKSRGSSKDGPTMIVCEDNIPHAFCIRHNTIMARKVAQFIEDIMLE